MYEQIDILNLDNNIEKENEISEKQKDFLNTNLGKVINAGIDIGLKAALPDFIENQIIDIKDALLENGLKEGIEEVVNQGIDLGKSAIGIFTGEFDNISQIENVVKKGGILDSTSDILDTAISFAQEKDIIDRNVSKYIRQGKNSIISAIGNKIEESLTEQIKNIEKLDLYCEKWKEAYNNQNLSEMEKNLKKIENYKEKTIPLRNILEKSDKIENIHTYIINNGNNFNLTEMENELLEKLL